ncbi:MAG TPA: hypothetical protein VFZ66_07145 [Herpetosiphonaceae bacterium]
MAHSIDHSVLTIAALSPSAAEPTHQSAADAASQVCSPPSAHSPLWMVTTEPLLNQFVADLQRLRQAIVEQPSIHRELCFSRAGLDAVRAAFASMIRHGEEQVHRLAQLLCATWLTSFQVQSVVIGEVETTSERFTLSQLIAPSEVYTATDLDLGNRQLKKLQFRTADGWSRAVLVANTVDYQPLTPNRYAIHRISTRIKAEEEIWNKVVDEIFDLDALVRRDKKLRHLSRYVKDIFGIKIVVGSMADAYHVHKALGELIWSDEQLLARQIEPGDTTRRLSLVEVKDYLGAGQRKRSGWQALKSVVQWSGKTIEIQIQPLHNFLHEREVLTRESHISFKAHREQVRDQVAAQMPLFRFYRDLLVWVFRTPSAPPPIHEGITVRLVP